MSSRPNKAQRQHLIAKLLEEHRVTNQAHLVELLGGIGVEVNVSTVSRDLEELGAIKVRIPATGPPAPGARRLGRRGRPVR